MRSVLACSLAAVALTGCASSGPQPSGVWSAPSLDASAPQAEYIIEPLDMLTITVFQVDDLTLKEARVDAGGHITLPLLGSVVAAGKTSTQLAEEITAKLKGRFLQSPQVSVMIKEAVGQKVTVDGAVTEPGVFVLKGRTTLMQAVAMAKGPGRNANMRSIAVFRMAGGQRTVGVFDLGEIRAGRTPDPEILGGDVVVVGSSAVKGLMREILTALPAFGIFRPY